MSGQFYAQLWHARQFTRSHMPFIESLEDWDIILLIGLYQERGAMICLKDIYSYSLGSAPTIERRISRMKNLGVILDATDNKDRRRVWLRLSPKMIATFRKFGRQTYALAGAIGE